MIEYNLSSPPSYHKLIIRRGQYAICPLTLLLPQNWLLEEDCIQSALPPFCSHKLISRRGQEAICPPTLLFPKIV